ncbi:DUF2306 domain-containing protein [Mycolicibacterium pulveris]|uniref:DUF2306 domain-containing protein n=1 Tax=Mycolicibacterium pulveris TaxID=36813 RepID=UPI003CE72E18
MPYAKMAGRRWPAPALSLVIALFLVFSLPPYFTGDTRVPATFSLHYPLLVAHVMLGSVAMVTALAQLWPGLRRRHPALHRRIGHIYVGAAIPAAASAIVIGAATPFGPLLAVSNVVLGTLWLWFTVNGFAAARQRNFAVHRRHMIRSATLTFSIISNRIWGPILFISFHPLRDTVFGGSEEHFLWLVAGIGGWLGWLVPLAVVQWWLNRKPVIATSPIP